MKLKYKLVAVFALLVITLNSCKKWVDYDPHDEFRITELDYLKSESDYRTMAVSAYTPLQWLNQSVQVGEIASDNAVTGGENASDVLPLQQIDDFTHTPVNATLTEIWSAAYEGINRVNYLHQYKAANIAGGSVEFAGKEALYGELYFLRAYYYFTLVRFFGDVPLFVDRRLTLADSRALTRSAKADVYKQIELDLTNAIAVLPAVSPAMQSQDRKGRVTKYSAQALLGKVYLYDNKFTEAVPVLDAIITPNVFSLVTNFASIFLASGENGPESVFEIQYSNGTPYYNWGAVTRGQGNLMVQQVGIRGINGSAAMPYASGWTTGLLTMNLANAYAAGDQRKDATILDIEAYKTANPALNVTYSVAPYKNTGLYNQKYQPRKGETSGQIELNYLNNFRTIRYAEVLLMAAEANNRAAASNDPKARQYLNLVRQRAFGNTNNDITVSGSALKQAIWDERRLELGGEGDRFFDLVRTGQAASKLTGFKVGKHEVFPIPQQEINISRLTQNLGY